MHFLETNLYFITLFLFVCLLQILLFFIFIANLLSNFHNLRESSQYYMVYFYTVIIKFCNTTDYPYG